MSDPGNVSQFACGNGYPAPFGTLAADTRCARKRNHGGDHQGEDGMGRIQRWSDPPYVVPESSSQADMDAAWDALSPLEPGDYEPMRLSDHEQVPTLVLLLRLVLVFAVLSIAPAVAIIMWRVAL